MTTVLFPGSFDPIHNGHVAVAETCAAIFETVVVSVGFNAEKPGGLFTIDQRMEMIQSALGHLPNIKVSSFSGLVTAAAADLGATCVIKGIRGASDLDSELVQAHMNATTGGMRTLLVPAVGAAALVASRYVREIATRGGDVSQLVPANVWARLQELEGS